MDFFFFVVFYCIVNKIWVFIYKVCLVLVFDYVKRNDGGLCDSFCIFFGYEVCNDFLGVGLVWFFYLVWYYFVC